MSMAAELQTRERAVTLEEDRLPMASDAEQVLAVEQALERLRQVNERLASGREYLVGERFTAADLTFAALAAPVLLPREYGGPMPSLAELPDAILSIIDEMRSTPAGMFGLRMYRDHRRPPT